ncbi:BMC_2a_G0033110.mRNA.1.CDS.1 [Saccharomyces cerevisiae]|nr:Sba1p [Saccharomyces cerevisiae YJM1447]CAI4655590.1 BMC_2a_G0033110.mRNA.1.CDS.1 [Saccharomyces cerevisiae]CAI4666453.1 BMB_G0033110.mRNA.1.CDS.1 [Saccharomyces cerevisiae]CAI7256580.1 BMC_2a_G0033110.mRNA.1.CDS.1 [Saccharomyces cerevisiae]CAI7259469.1 BMB_G0033110.mRNA.1.CDS.1 [Saccharomyces cerevisiae]
MSDKVINPQVAWAQRSSTTDPERNYVLITVSIADCDAPELTIKPSYIELKAQSKPHVGDENVHHYQLHIDLYKEIIPEKTMHKVANGQHYFLKLYKKDLESEYWPRLTKEKVKYPYIKTDFDKWVDEDEQDEVEAEGNDAAQGMDFSQMMGGAGGMDFSKMMGGAGGAGSPDMAQLQQLLAQSGGNLDMGDFKENDEEDEEEEIEPEVKA